MASSVEELAQEWLRIDKDEKTRDDIYQLLVKGDKHALEARLRPRIAFGTAGLRARMEAGFARMNSVSVIQASQGLAEYVLQNVEDAKHKGIVIGRDARHNSDKFARLTAAAFLSKGIKVWWFDEPVHTPLVPFAVRQFSAAAAVMITASHNPAQDNGYKVYWSNGAQIIPPHDAGIATAIDQSLHIDDSGWNINAVDHDMQVEHAFGLVEQAYCTAVKAAIDPDSFLSSDRIRKRQELRFTYTPMHGVGLKYMTAAVKNMSIESLMSVVEPQAHPNPDFPTVKFPNPEEKGALDLAMQVAEEEGLQFIIANDPDADRFAAAQKIKISDGAARWHQFTGNELGILLAYYVFSEYKKTRSSPEELTKLTMLSSTVSSGMLAAVAKAEGFTHVETLTGFKWMGNVAYDYDQKGYDSRFAFEEAIGYMVPGVSHDKDGVAAGMLFITAAAHWLEEEQLTPWEKLQQLYAQYGYFADANTYLISPSPTTTNAVFEHLRSLKSSINAYTYPARLGPHKITYWRDLTVGYESSNPPEFVPSLPVDRTAQMLTAEIDDGEVRFTVRGSGTEPKIKFYVEGKSRSSNEDAKRKADAVLNALLTEWFGDEKWGLQKP